ncbi:hypothetical protein AB0O07_19680 [Streptomyces sp. NPDC093085]|uniref:hypothetical protein n=1 Tax=Streptomyces sp. NPDC093085 TaxID=3155068 RepID=UPI00341CE72C
MSKEAAIERFLQEYPRAAEAGRGHPALQGCEEIDWAGFPACPARIPTLLRAVLEPVAASAAAHTLTHCLIDSIAAMNPAAPAALPFLLRLAGDPGVTERAALLDLLVLVAGFAESVDGECAAMTLWYGSEAEHPERALCRAVFAEYARVVEAVGEHLTPVGGRDTLRQAAGLG